MTARTLGRPAPAGDRAPRSSIPSARWYRAAAAVLALGIVLAVAWFLHAITVQTNAVNDFTDVALFPGSTVEVVEAGPHTVWAGPGCNGACRVRSAQTYREHYELGFTDAQGRAVPVTAAAKQSFNVGSGREGRAVWLVTFPAPGAYAPEMSGDLDPTDGGVPRPRLWLSPGEGLPVRALRGSSALAGGAALVAGAMVVVTVVRRRRAFARIPPALGP